MGRLIAGLLSVFVFFSFSPARVQASDQPLVMAAAGANCQAVGAKAQQGCMNQACAGTNWVKGGFGSWAECAENCRLVSEEETALCKANAAKAQPPRLPPVPTAKTPPPPPPLPLPPLPATNVAVWACTDLTESVYVAMAKPVGNNAVDIEGWWVVPRASCIKLTDTPDGDYHYFYAYSQNGDFQWPIRGGTQMCVKHGKFKIANWSLANAGTVRCPPGYEARGMFRKKAAGTSEIRVHFNPD